MYIILFWVLITGYRIYLNKFDYKYIDLYMSTFHSIGSILLYYNEILYQNNIANIIQFSYLYFLFDAFITSELQYKLHHIITLCGIITTNYYNSNSILLCKYLFYAEYPVLLYNYVYYIEKEKYDKKFPIYYKSFAILHWILIIHSRVYNMGHIGYEYIKNINDNLYFYSLLTIHSILYLASIDWIIKRGKELLLLHL